MQNKSRGIMDFTKRRKTSKLSVSDLSGKPTGIFSLRSILVISFLFLILLLSYRLQVFPSSSIRSTRIHPNFSVLSSSTTNSILKIPNSSHFALPELRLQARVLLPDSLLILLDNDSGNQIPVELHRAIDCVYHNSSSRSAISIDEYNEFRWMVRCPLPPANRSSSVELRWREGGLISGSEEAVVNFWDRVAYEAVEDSGTAVVFVKGFNLRRDKKFDPNQILCKFESGVITTTTAIGVAQEVVRCPLPVKSVNSEIGKNRGGGVNVAVDWLGSRHSVSSVARLYEFKKKKGDDDVYNLCGCTMVWNQAHALREWVVYHARLGVQRWFIYDNNSEDGLRSEIESLNSEGFNVTRHPWPWIKTQEAGFSHCVLRSKGECDWVAFFDVDEFYYFLPSSKRGEIGVRLNNSLGKLVAENSNSNLGEIRTKCRSFGPSGLTTRPTRGVMVGYTCRIKGAERHKSIVKPGAVDSTLANVVHHFRLREGFVSKNVAESRVVINHYKYQAWDAFKSKFSRRVSTYVADWGEDSNVGSKDRAPGLGKEAVRPRDWSRWFCEVWDTGLRDFVVGNLADRDSGLLPWE